MKEKYEIVDMYPGKLTYVRFKPNVVVEWLTLLLLM
jgi:hypothetical protein